jgi:biotin operon repressor
MINITYIYLIENIDNDPYKVYIGKTKNPNTRYKNHKRNYGGFIIYTIIDKIESNNKKDWEPLESYWIEQFKHWGYQVINQNKGGGGPSRHTEGTKFKISTKNKHKTKHTLEFKNKISLISKNRKITDKTRKSMSISAKGHKRNLGKIHSKENILKRSKPIIQYDINKNFIKEWESGKQISKYLGISNSNITSCCKGRLKSTGGFIWRYEISYLI